VDLDPEDLEGNPVEAPIYQYMVIRHKPLLSPDGKKAIRPAGGWRVGGSASLDEEDREFIEGTILDWTAARVFFRTMESTTPECKSKDGITGTVHGRCEECQYAKWSGSERPPCRETRELFFMDLNGGGYVVTLQPSGIKPFRLFYDRLRKQLADKLGRDQGVPLHIFRVKIGTELTAKPQPHFTPTFEVAGVLSPEEKVKAREAKKILASVFERSLETKSMEATDFLGKDREPVREAAFEELPGRDPEDDLPF
jgi:hypothetical protein